MTSPTRDARTVAAELLALTGTVAARLAAEMDANEGESSAEYDHARALREVAEIRLAKAAKDIALVCRTLLEGAQDRERLDWLQENIVDYDWADTLYGRKTRPLRDIIDAERVRLNPEGHTP